MILSLHTGTGHNSLHYTSTNPLYKQGQVTIHFTAYSHTPHTGTGSLAGSKPDTPVPGGSCLMSMGVNHIMTGCGK